MSVYIFYYYLQYTEISTGNFYLGQIGTNETEETKNREF